MVLEALFCCSLLLLRSFLKGASCVVLCSPLFLQYCTPGSWLTDLSLGRYDVREKKCVKKVKHMNLCSYLYAMSTCFCFCHCSEVSLSISIHEEILDVISTVRIHVNPKLPLLYALVASCVLQCACVCCVVYSRFVRFTRVCFHDRALCVLCVLCVRERERERGLQFICQLCICEASMEAESFKREERLGGMTSILCIYAIGSSHC
jgi:hypothetical protein